MDRKKVIEGLEFTIEMITFNPSTGEEIESENLNEADKTSYDACVGAIELLKEQEEREQRICKSICNFIRGACSTDTDDDKDFVCYEIQKCFTEGR